MAEDGILNIILEGFGETFVGHPKLNENDVLPGKVTKMFFRKSGNCARHQIRAGS